MDPNFLKVGNIYINLSRVLVVRDYPEAREALVVFGDPQVSELLGAEERKTLFAVLEEKLSVHEHA